MIDTSLSHYRITEKLGEGGMGVVYKARDTHLDRFVALKILPAEKVADPDRRRRFVQEAKAASALNHPHIVTIYDIDEADGVHFIAMEYVDGKTLDQLIPRHGMRLNEALKVAVQMADALAAAHEAGIVHRDLKPGNLMVTEKGQVKVLDFGLAKLTEKLPLSAEDATLTAKPDTEEGKILGTVAYMSPEQAEGKKVDARSDIFSLGSVLYEMMTGEKAFQGSSKISTLSAILHQEPKPISTIGRTIPPDLEKLISRCLRKDPERRIRHMDDVKLALEDLKEESDSGALASAVPIVKSRWQKLIWIGGGAALIALITVSFWLLRTRPSAPPVQVRALPLTAHAGEETEPSFSPDGNSIAFSWNGERQDNFDIYLKLIGPGEPLRLTSDPAMDRNPVWSPDGRWIAFLRVSPSGTAAVLLIPALSGPERKIGEISIDVTMLFLQQSHLTWTRDGKGLVVSHDGSENELRGLFLLSPHTGEKRRLTTGSSLSPAFSPDGRRLAYIKYAGMSVSDLYVMVVSDEIVPQREPRRLTVMNEELASPAWTSDGQEIVFSSGAHSAQRNLWRISATPGNPPRREPIGEDGTTLAISQDGRRLAYSRRIFDADIWGIKLRSRTELAGPPAKLISSTRMDCNPQYSPDGKRIAFNSFRSGTEEVWVANADGTQPLQLTFAGGPMVADPRWSPDGQTLVIHSMLGGVRGIDLISANGGALRRVAEGGVYPTWSRDGKWIYFGRDGQLWKIPSGGGAATQVTKVGTTPGHSMLTERIGAETASGSAFESEDGKFLYYANDSQVRKVALDGGQEIQIVGEPLSFGQNLALVEDGLYLISSSGFNSPGILYFFDFASGRLTPLITIQRWALGLTVSPDRRTILYSQGEQTSSDLMLVENFH